MATTSVGSQGGLIIDDRENKLADTLARLYPDLPVSTARLLTGDVHVLRGGKPQLVLERKTREDLRASLLDGRFHAQRARLVSEYGCEHVGFVVEGGTRWSESESGAEIALIVRDRIPVFWTRNVDDTAALLNRLSGADLAERAEPPSGENFTRVANASTGCPKRSLAAMLRCVPSVSARRAATLADKFKSMDALIQVIRDDREDAIRQISDCKSRIGGSRFGGALAHRVVTCLLGPSPNSQTRETSI